MATTPERYPELSVSGAPRELGRQIGEAAREKIRAFCDIALQRINMTADVTREQSRAVAASCLDIARRYNPPLLDELEGTAEAADVDLIDLMLLQVRNQLTAEAESGCTSLSLQPNLVAQNWDNDPALDDFTIVLTRHPDDRPALTTLTQAGLIAYIGFNDAGIGACLNTLPAPSRAIGVPHYFTLRDLYEQTSLDDAVESIRRAHRAIPANIILATPQGPADLEVTVDAVHVLTSTSDCDVTHTNHCLHPNLLPINDRFPELIQSHSRKKRIDALLATAGAENRIEGIKAALRDHDGHPYSICRHPNPDPETGFWTTVFSVIIEPSARKMHVSRGTPCDRSYEVYEMPPV
ncbi:MAG: C45 family peptidase [Planctomycetaceae bacterium]